MDNFFFKLHELVARDRFERTIGDLML
jgi:hypothetical protein